MKACGPVSQPKGLIFLVRDVLSGCAMLNVPDRGVGAP